MRYTYNFDQPPAGSEDELTRLLGGKGRNLALMRTDLGLPVPPGFTITTETGKAFSSDGWPEALTSEIREQIGSLEAEVGRSFGGEGEPLLVSVRSGAAVSMPGMMDTILNLGLNDDNVAALAEACGDTDFANESLARLRSMYRSIVGTEAPSDPWEQLRGAIEAVFASWNSSRARSYREKEGIPEDLGTAVTVQAMVFGNLDDDSGTGVLFTRNPATGEPGLYGDILFRAQGEDVVAGNHQTDSIDTLADRLPTVAEELSDHATTLEHHFSDVCDIEFTIERGKLWLLQVRIGKRSPQAALRFAVDMAEDDGFPLTREEAIARVTDHIVGAPELTEVVGGSHELLGTGLPASPGLASGVVATSATEAVTLAESGAKVILVRPETSPEDVHGMARAAGILTSTGGLASHAAVVARGWGLPAVVGAGEVQVSPDGIEVAGKSIASGETITINGETGEIFLGNVETRTVVPAEVEVLKGWAEELGIELAGSATEESASASDDDGPDSGTVEIDDLIRLLHIKGFATTEAIAEICFASPETIAELLEEMEGRGELKKMGPMFQLAEGAKQRGEELMAQDIESWTTEAANEALDGFLPLDHRMKHIVTAWQMREVDGEQVLNDHTDPDYDAGVLAELAALHTDASTWIEPLGSGLPRLTGYARRLERAAQQVAAGNHDYIASPRIDSYHNVWFELHEELIQLAGRTREEETKAGRA